MNKELIVITGASSGIGEAAAKIFSALGHPLLLLARRVERMEKINLQNTLCRKVDVTSLNDIRSAIREAEEKYGPAGCIINNAGVMLLGDVSIQNPNEWQKMLDVNVMGVMNGMHAVLPDMVQRKHGTIINISSIAGRKTFPNHAVYCGTKFAVHAVTENLRQEVAPYNVRVIVIAPGAVETELLGHTTSEKIKQNYEAWKKEMGNILNADDVAKAIVYAYQQPQSVCIREIVLAATKQEP